MLSQDKYIFAFFVAGMRLGEKTVHRAAQLQVK
jgi:hypothetical protein